MLASCSQGPKQNYVVTLNAGDAMNDKMAYIIDFDTEDNVLRGRSRKAPLRCHFR